MISEMKRINVPWLHEMDRLFPYTSRDLSFSLFSLSFSLSLSLSRSVSTVICFSFSLLSFSLPLSLSLYLYTFPFCQAHLLKKGRFSIFLLVGSGSPVRCSLPWVWLVILGRPHYSRDLFSEP